jgi:hypothetical protein
MILNSYKINKGIIIIKQENTSGGVIIADKIVIITTAHFLYSFKKSADMIPILAEKNAMIGVSKTSPIANDKVINVDT